MSLTWIKPGIGYIGGVVNSGVIATPDNRAIVIDTGLDGDAGRRIRRGITEAGLELAAIINTHSHADHFGGNRWLLNRVDGCEVYAPELEEALIRHPDLEPFYLFGGAVPPEWLQSRFFQAEPSPVHHILQHGRQTVCGVDFEVVPLPGHSLGQVGIASGGVLFAADSFYGLEALAKHACPFLVDADATRASWQVLAERTDDHYLPGHGPLLAQADLPETLAANREKLDLLEATVQAAARDGQEEGALLRHVMSAAGLELRNEALYYLNRAPLLAILTSLRRRGRLVSRLDGLQVMWQTAQ